MDSGDVIIENPSNLDDSGKENENEIIGLVEDQNNSKENNSSNIIELKDESKRNSIGLKTLNELNGKDSFIIDLESGTIQPKKLTGPQLLFQKYLKTQARPKHKDSICMNLLSVENGKLENQKVEVRLDKEVELDHSRPGYSHEKLKENLRNQIMQQRLEKLKQRFYKSDTAELEPEDMEHFPNNKMEQNCKNNSESEDEDYVQSDQDIEEESSDSDSEVVTQKKKKNKEASKFLDDEAIDSDEEQCNEEESSESEGESQSENESDTEQNDLVPRKGRILKAFEDSDDESCNNKNEFTTAQEIISDNLEKDQVDNAKVCSVDQDFLTPDLEVLKASEDLFNSQATDFTFNEPSVSEEIGTNNLEALFDAPSQVNNDDDLMDLCSGQFVSTPSDIILTNNDFNFSQNVLTNTTEVESDDFVSQVPENKEKEPLEDSFVMEVPESNVENPKGDENKSKGSVIIEDQELTKNTECNEIEDEVAAEPVKKLNKLLESTDDEQEVTNESDKKKIKRKKKKKEKVKKLGFSDDEEEELNVINMDMLDEESLSEEEAIVDDPEVFVDYDSEENEIEVKLTKKDREKVAKNYFENEAELSESEWGSADEDEKGLDKYDISDLADEEEFDQNQLREEVGRIHARKVMDEDIKNVKKIQDLLFEDEENDGVGRERKFRWKNQTEGFTINDENALDVDDLPNAEQEEENEIMWRRMRHEREMLINEQSHKMADSDTMSTDILLLDQNSQTVTTASTSSLVKRKFQIIKSNSTSFGVNLSSESNKIDSPFLIKAASSKKFTHSSFLSRDEQTLCKIASFISTKEDEVTNLSSHGGNSMSFAPIEKKEIECKKRKSEGNNQPNSNGKKRKVENQRFLLDQLK